MGFEVSRNNYFMYKPSWQQNAGARMKQMNREVSDSYYANFSSLGSSLLSTMNDQTASMMEITTQVVQKRLQDGFAKKLEQAKSGLDVTV